MATRPPMGIGAGLAAPMPPAPAAPAGGMQSAPARPDVGTLPEEEGIPATPEEQAMYTKLVTAGLDMVVPEGQDMPTPQIMESLAGKFPEAATQMFAQAQPPIDANPLDAAAVTGTLIVLMAEGQVEQSGMQIPNDVVFHAGADILEYVVNVSDAAGIHDFSEEDMEKVIARAMDLYRTTSPRADQEALAGEFEQVIAADKAGQLDTMLPNMGNRGAPQPQQG